MALLVGVSALGALLAAEIFVRLFIPVTDVAFQFWDPAVGMRRRPNQTGRNISGGFVRGAYSFNAAGWNYPREFEVLRPPGTLRIALVGDSYVEALQVPCEKQMAVVVEEAMARSGRKAQCYPFGCAGMGTAQEYQVIRHYALDYRPDVVLIFFTQNDVHDSSPYLRPIEDAIPSFALDAENRLELMPAASWQPSLVRRLSAKSALARYFLVQKSLLFAGARRGPAGVTLREVTADVNTRRYLGGDMSEEQRGWKSWQLIETLLAAAKADCGRGGVALGVVFRGCIPEIAAAEQKTEYRPPARETDPCCVDERVQEMGREFVGPIAAKLGIPYLDLTDALKLEVIETGQSHNFPDDNHYNELGHRVAGEAIAEWVLTGMKSRSDTAPAGGE